MSKAFLHISHWLLIVALSFALGGHWLVLQSVAWGTMIVEYAQRSDFVEAVEKTFDGQHPCSICKKIEQGRNADIQSAPLVLVEKMDFFHHRVPGFVVLANEFRYEITGDRFSVTRRLQPPVPPPRAA